MDITALEQIKRTKHRYLRCVNLKLWDELADVLAPDATADYGTHALGEPARLSGRDAILGFLRENLSGGIITTHAAGQPEIDVAGETATGTWSFEDTVLAPEHRVLIKGAAFYEDSYVRDETGTWRIRHTGYVRVYEMMMSLDDVPSLRLTANRWADPADSGSGPLTGS